MVGAEGVAVGMVVVGTVVGESVGRVLGAELGGAVGDNEVGMAVGAAEGAAIVIVNWTTRTFGALRGAPNRELVSGTNTNPLYLFDASARFPRVLVVLDSGSITRTFRALSGGQYNFPVVGAKAMPSYASCCCGPKPLRIVVSDVFNRGSKIKAASHSFGDAYLHED